MTSGSCPWVSLPQKREIVQEPPYDKILPFREEIRHIRRHVYILWYGPFYPVLLPTKADHHIYDVQNLNHPFIFWLHNENQMKKSGDFYFFFFFFGSSLLKACKMTSFLSF